MMELEFEELPIRAGVRDTQCGTRPIVGLALMPGTAYLSSDIDGDWFIEKIILHKEDDWNLKDQPIDREAVLTGDAFRDARDYLQHPNGYADAIEDIKAQYSNTPRDGMDQWKDESGYHDAA